jgi:hypothetical protein
VEEDGELGMGPTSAKEDRPVNMILSGGEEDGDLGFGRFAFSWGKEKKRTGNFIYFCPALLGDFTIYTIGPV